MVGRVDPRNLSVFTAACAAADVVLIEAKDLIWLCKRRPGLASAALGDAAAVVVLSEHQLLDVAAGCAAPAGLVMRGIPEAPPASLLQLAIEGYMAASEALLHRMLSDRLRLDIVHGFSDEERRVLACLGGGLSNRAIAEATGLSESRIKTLVHLLIQKLRMSNRTAVGVFAVTHELI